MRASRYELISRKQAEYARCLDDDDLEAWPDFFHPECLYKVTTADNYREGLEGAMVYADSRAMLEDRISALRQANIYERHRYRHILGQPGIVSESEREVCSETPFLVARTMRQGETTLFAAGRYVDRYRFEGGEPRLAERIVVCDSSAIDTLLAVPL